MQNENKPKSNRFFNVSVAAVLIVSMASASLMTGCFSKKESSETDATKLVVETQIATRVINGVLTDEEGNILTDENGEPMTAPSGTPDSDAVEKNENDDSKTSDGGSEIDADENDNNGQASNGGSNSNNSKDSDGSGKSDKSSDSKTSNGSDNKTSNNSDKSSNKPNNGSGKLTIGKKSYSVGDTVTCTYSVTTPDYFINYQGYVEYDNTLLKATGAKLMGKASSGGIVNYKRSGRVLFNGSRLNGYDYYDGGEFLEVTYEVVGGGSADPALVWQVVTDENYKAMVTNGEIKSSFKVTESYK